MTFILGFFGLNLLPSFAQKFDINLKKNGSLEYDILQNMDRFPPTQPFTLYQSDRTSTLRRISNGSSVNEFKYTIIPSARANGYLFIKAKPSLQRP